MPRICGSCGRESSHITTTFEVAGKPLADPVDSCDRCSDVGPVHSVTDRKLWTGYDAEPQKYDKTTGKDGETVYVAKEETRKDYEDDFSKGDASQEERANRILHMRRHHGDKRPLTPAEAREKAAALAKIVREARQRKQAEDAGIHIFE